MGIIGDVLMINPMCQIQHHEMKKVFGTYVYYITGFIDLDGSYGIEGSFKFHMKNKSFDVTFSSNKELDIVNGVCMTFNDIYTKNFKPKEIN